MTSSTRPAVVVTGASTGIGDACVGALVDAGFFVFGSMRKEADAEGLRRRHGQNFAPLFFDVRDDRAIAAAAGRVAAHLEGRVLAGLVNNAGVALPGPLLYQPIDEFRQQIEINLVSQLRIIQAFAHLLGAGEARIGAPGRIVNMSSVAGTLATPYPGRLRRLLQTRAGRFFRRIAARVDDFRRRCDRHPARRHQDADLGQSAISRYFSLRCNGLRTRRALDAEICGRAAKNRAPPERVAKAVLRALTAKRLPTRIRVCAQPTFRLGPAPPAAHALHRLDDCEKFGSIARQVEPARKPSAARRLITMFRAAIAIKDRSGFVRAL